MSAGRNRASTRPTIPVPRVETSSRAGELRLHASRYEQAADILRTIIEAGIGDADDAAEHRRLRRRAAELRFGSVTAGTAA